MTMVRSPQYGATQAAFIAKVRDAVKSNPKSFFASNNWRDVTPTKGRYDSSLIDPNSGSTCDVDDFYVKSIAVWVPHLLIPAHTPSCPNCNTSEAVYVDSARWINAPKILYGKERHRYLDTMLYPCKRCGRHFAGYNKASMQLDAEVYFGHFNYYLGHRFAVDEELYRYIIDEATTQSTAGIAKKLTICAYTAFYDDHQMYLAAVKGKKARARKKQKMMDSYLQPATNDPELAKLQRRKATAQFAVNKVALDLSGELKRRELDISFTSLLKSKMNHNITGSRNIIPGIGQAKIETLIKLGITSAFQLQKVDPKAAGYKGSLKKNLMTWASIVDAYYDAIEDKIKRLRRDHKECSVDFKDANNAYNEYVKRPKIINPYAGGIRRKPRSSNNLNMSTPGVSEELREEPVLCEFSKFDDKAGYNGRVLSKYRIDQIVSTVFNHRKAFIESKMMCLTACVLKVDFNYKIASKIRVWTKQGQSFSPYKCIATIQNEEGLTVFWKALKHSESFSEMNADLVRLRARLNNNLSAVKSWCKPCGPEEQAVKVVYVDNCCTVRGCVRRCFPGAMVKLDAFHWLKRWNDILVEPTKEMGGIFRAMMSRALFNITPDEYEAAKTKLVAKKKRDVSAQEIRKAAKSIIPPRNIQIKCGSRSCLLSVKGCASGTRAVNVATR
jgi:hypothetical protein